MGNKNRRPDDRMVIKIGILGGTFDPIHVGHLLMAEEAASKHSLDKVLFVPNNQSPLKKNHPQASNAHRLNMLDLAMNEIVKFEVSDFEIKQKGPSYTVETARHFKKNTGKNTELYFILGEDAFVSIHKWKDAKTLLGLVNFLVFRRVFTGKNSGEKLTIEWINGFLRSIINQESSERVFILNGVSKISSSNVRKRIEQGKSVSILVPRVVEEYILRHRLYHND